MWVELPPVWIGVLNLLGIPAVHLLVAWVSARLPREWFQDSGRIGKWEEGFYEKVLRVRRWKGLLPDAGPWFGGMAKRRLESRNREYLRNLLQETRRGEWSHWVQMGAVNVCLLWTPMPWGWVIAGYALLSNLPCVVSLRHTRLRLRRIVATSDR